MRASFNRCFNRCFRQARNRALSVSALALAVALPSVASAADVGSLPPEQRAFLADEDNLARFGLTPEKLAAMIAARDDAGARALVASLMKTTDDAKYQAATTAPAPDQGPLDPVGDMAAVPLKTDAPNFNGGTVLRPEIFDEYRRDPGPFSLKRYVYEQDPIPTFAGAPVALRKADLVAGKVDVAFVGVPIDFSSGWRDAANAPSVLRSMYGASGFDIYAGVDPSLELSLADYGDLTVDRMSPEMGVDHVRKMVAEMADAGVIPFVVGGDHSVMFPTVAAMADHYGQGKVGVVQLDAHYDGARDQAHVYSDDQAVSRLIQRGIVHGKDIVQIGVRGQETSSADIEWMRNQGIQYHTMAAIEGQGWEKVLATALSQIKAGPENVFVSFDISVLDPAYAAAAGRPSPGGLTIREAIPLVRRICAETKVVGFEMLDVAPYLDLSYRTALNANYVMHACLTGIAMRKGGIKDPAYLSPLTASATGR